MRTDWDFPPDYYERSLTVLETALDRVGAYKAWREYDPGQGQDIDKRYAAMPALTKKDIRAHFPGGFLLDGADIESALASGEISFVKTSGSIDVSVTNVWHQAWWDASERASWKLNSHAARLATGNHAEAILANPMNVGIISDKVDLPLEKRRLARFLYLNEKSSPLQWTPALMDRMIDELSVFKPAILEANPSLLARLCRHIVRAGKRVYQPGLITFTYEYPTTIHHRQIQQVFSSPLASSYGTTETGYVFMQCEAGKFHQNTDFCRVDFQPLKKEHGGPALGRLLVTTFDNPWYYMLRFDVGDLGRIDESGRCECGRNTGMILSAVEGRAASATLTVGGRLVTARELDSTLGRVDGIDEYRLDQTAPDRYELHIASLQENTAYLEREIVAALKGLYGRDSRIVIVHEDDIAPEGSGKYCVARNFQPVNIEHLLDRSGDIDA
jgi:phenylacetate-coenzyme A ligase PaaK-like adenylate-forming protein